MYSHSADKSVPTQKIVSQSRASYLIHDPYFAWKNGTAGRLLWNTANLKTTMVDIHNLKSVTIKQAKSRLDALSERSREN